MGLFSGERVTRRELIRALVGIFAALGFVWALLGIAGAFLFFESFKYVRDFRGLFDSISSIVLLASGYWIWAGWLLYSFKERYPHRLSPKVFWGISLVHHLACLGKLIPMDVWGGGDDPRWIPALICLYVVVAAAMAFFGPGKEIYRNPGWT